MFEIYQNALALSKSDAFGLQRAARIDTPVTRLMKLDPSGWRAKAKAISAIRTIKPANYWSK